MKRLSIFFIIILVNSFLFLSCPMEDFGRCVKYYNYEFSDEIIKKDIPVELTIRCCFEELGDINILAIELLEDVETILLEGKLFEWNDKNAIFVEFVNPPKQEVNSDITQDSPYFLNPYCKLRLVFKKAGTYMLRLKGSSKNDPWSNFDGGCDFTIINVVE